MIQFSERNKKTNREIAHEENANYLLKIRWKTCKIIFTKGDGEFLFKKA